MSKQTDSSAVHAAIMDFMGTVERKVLRAPNIQSVAARLNLGDMKDLHSTLDALSQQGRIRYSRNVQGCTITLREPVTTRRKKRR